MLALLRTQYLKGAKGDDLSIREEKFTSLLSEMTEVFESEDWILLADLLEYEFAPLCIEWRTTSQNVYKAMQEQKA